MIGNKARGGRALRMVVWMALVLLLAGGCALERRQELAEFCSMLKICQMEELKWLPRGRRENLGFFKLVREGETDERLDRAAELLKELIWTVQSGFNETVGAIKSVKADTSAMLEKQDKMLEKQDRMLEKQDLQMEITKNGFDDMRKGFAEVKEEMKAGFTDVKEEIHMQRDDFREVFMHVVSELRSEIAEVKATLARMQAAG